MELKFSNSVRNNVLIIIIYVAFCESRTLFLKREIHENNYHENYYTYDHVIRT